MENGICYGQTDLPLDYKDFLIKRKYILNKIQQYSLNWDMIYSSPLLRCKQLAKYISKKLNLSLIYHEFLKEFYYGNWENVPFKEIQTEMEEWSKDYIHLPVPGGESLKTFLDRTFKIYKELINLNSNIIVVTHMGVIRSFYLFYYDTSIDTFFDFSLDYGDLFLLNKN